MKNIEKISHGDKLLAIVLRKEFDEPGPHFFTPNEFSQQLGMLSHKKGKIIPNHRHKVVKRDVSRTQEVLLVLKGRVRVDLYARGGRKVESVILNPGDSILLAYGGHGLEILEDSKMIEVKQGPYLGVEDKEFF